MIERCNFMGQRFSSFLGPGVSDARLVMEMKKPGQEVPLLRWLWASRCQTRGFTESLQIVYLGGKIVTGCDTEQELKGIGLLGGDFGRILALSSRQR